MGTKTKNAPLRGLALWLGLVLLLSLSACGSPGGAGAGGLTEAVWRGNDSATFKPDGSGSEGEIEQAGKTAEGEEVFALMRLNLGTEFLASELAEARLFLKISGESKPSSLRIGPVMGYWGDSATSYEDVKALIDEKSAVTVEPRDEADGWVSVPLTDLLRTWLSGGLQNNGLALFGETAGEICSFISCIGATVQEEETPYLKVSGKACERPLTYGKFGFTEILRPDDMHSNGNCMSYALRDMNAILEGDLGVDMGEMERIYAQADENKGVDALAEYFARLAVDYVEAHKESLKISGFRRIDGFDSKIDPEAEYRIALRVGVDLPEGVVDFSDMHSWDFHYWLQLSDGRWSQKFPTGPSVIVPCTGPGISPGGFPWDSAYGRTPKTADYYTSQVVYFAVTKEGGEFTRHRGEMEDRPNAG
ncbi:MAG: DNRLRE domain-containing protein [Christensenellaceae bacterium]|jgi:hypothetical protein|nr:DNRLRE domain-containing protein [Christensenellaceae bacterium]